MDAQTLTIQIGPVAYTVNQVERLYSDDHRPLMGQIDPSALRIKLNAEQASAMKTVTLWHELVHAVLFNAGITEHDERLVDAIAFGVADALRQNPALRTQELPWTR